MLSRALAVEACFLTMSSKVRLVSSIITVSEPFTSTPARSKIAGAIWAASSVMASSPRLLARRLAGSMVRQITRLPVRAMARASAAEVVVLPTPPQPTQRTTFFLSSSLCMRTAAGIGMRTLLRRLGGAFTGVCEQ